MSNRMFKVQISMSEYGLESYYYRLPTVLGGSHLDKFKSDVRHRYAFLGAASLKISWLDYDGDKIRIFNEEDMLTFNLLKGRKLLIEVGFTEATAQEPNIANNPPENLDIATARERNVANNPHTTSAVTFSVTDDDPSSVFHNTDKLEDKNKGTVDVRGALAQFSRQFYLPIADTEDVKGACCLPFPSRSAEKGERRSSLLVPEKYSPEKKPVRFSLPDDGHFKPANVGDINTPDRPDSPYDYSVEHTNPYVQKSLIRLAEMGFRMIFPLIDLLESVNGDLIEFFDKIQYRRDLWN